MAMIEFERYLSPKGLKNLCWKRKRLLMVMRSGLKKMFSSALCLLKKKKTGK